MAVNLLSGTKVNNKTSRQTRGCGHSCLLCAAPAQRDHGICGGCQRDLVNIKNFCLFCATPLAATGFCGKCLNKAPPAWNYAYAGFEYAYPVNRLIQLMKFRQSLAATHVLAKQMAVALAPVIARRSCPEVLVPVPLHKKRLAVRGYNQAHEIAKALGNELCIPVNPDLCQRVRHTDAQIALNAARRKQNLRGAFQCQERLCKGKIIALVDDVITTTATAREIAQCMKSAGAHKLIIWAIARQQLIF